MKLYVALLSAAVAVSSAQPHRHGHQHLHKEKRVPDFATVSGPTEIVYVLNGIAIPESEVQQGLHNGSLVLANNGELSSASPSSTHAAATSYAAPTSASSSSSSITSHSSSVYVAPTTTSAAPSSTSSKANLLSDVTSAAAAAVSSLGNVFGGSGSSSSSFGSGATGVDADFPDGEVSCGTFPSDYGAVAVEWLGLGGWTGIQSPGSDNGGFSNIMTVTSGGSCGEGDYCSYACPQGYQKSQWPSTQGSTGQSVGGIQCKNGKLHLTNSALSSKLCMKGSEQVQIQVQNNLSKNVAVCRTDYPGTESETVPVNAEAGGYANLTCPDAANYYKWQGGSTSAQYYVNPAGVSVSDACQWGSSANPWGNYAPLNLGVGWSNGAAWLSIFQNSPTTDAKLQFTVEIKGDGLSGTCKYSNGQYCGGANFDECSETTGCTVSISSGTATFVFSD